MLGGGLSDLSEESLELGPSPDNSPLGPVMNRLRTRVGEVVETS